jgi:hypothetical protein
MWWLWVACRAVEPVEPGSTETMPPPAPSSACDPLDPEVCALPWPSSYYQPTLPDEPGGAPQLGATTLPADRDDVHVDPSILGFVDGYSTMTPLLAYWPDVDGSTLPGPDQIASSLADDAMIIVVDAETGERVPTFSELDAHGAPGRQLLMVRPVVPLRHGARYVVGMRRLRDTNGELLAPSPHFLALRDGLDDAEDDDLGWRQPRYDQAIFPVLEGQGFAREELQLAWDFSTGTLEGSVGAMVALRDAALAEVGPDGPPYVIDSVEDSDCDLPGATIGRTITGRFTVPRYVVDDEAPTRLARDDEGTPVKVGTTEADFLFRVPCSVLADPDGGAMLLDYGHGLLGNLDEARTGHLSTLANERRYVLFSMTWVGMGDEDILPITQLMLSDVSSFPAVPERSAQGLVNRLTGLRAARGPLRDDPALLLDGQRLIGDELGYYGISQGGIVGGAYVALSTDHHRAVFGVGGMPYSLLLARSNDFSPFYAALSGRFPDPRDTALLIAVFQSAWDIGESAGYAAHTTADPLLGAPAKRVLMQVAIGDAQVSTLGAHVMARAYGAVTLQPANRPIWGIDTVDGPHEGSAIVEWAYDDGAVEPANNLPPDADADTHECPRREPAAQEQLARFLSTGRVEATCDGPCVGTRAGFCD